MADHPFVIRLLPVCEPRPSENIIPRRLEEVASHILKAGFWRVPIVLDALHGVVLDGHHRLAFALREGFSVIPCLLIRQELVALRSWRADVVPTPADIIWRGISGHLYPPKTTRHIVPAEALIRCAVPLADLRSDVRHYSNQSGSAGATSSRAAALFSETVRVA